MNVVWSTPSADALGSMPIGNGDIGINVWVEPSGDLCFFLGKSDAWDENMTLAKVGKVRVTLTPALVSADEFVWTLDVRGGRVVVTTPQIRVELWVDAHHNVIQVDARSADRAPIEARAEIEIWRTKKRPIGLGAGHDTEVYQEREPAFAYPDAVLSPSGRQVGWYHRNQVSSWLRTLEVQNLLEITASETDPLLNRTFGALVRGDAGEWRVESPTGLAGKGATGALSLRVHVLTAVTETVEEWQAALDAQADAVDRLDGITRRAAHDAWWAQFWDRSWVRIDGDDPAAEQLSQAYALQRFMTASAGRGAYPIKFNGSLFTVDNTDFGPDYRMWGAGTGSRTPGFRTGRCSRPATSI